MNKKKSRTIQPLVFVVVVLVLVALIGFLIFLGKGKSKYAGLDDESIEVLVPQLSRVTIDPAVVYSTDTLRGVPVLKRQMNHVVYQYQWFVNGDVVPNVDTNILEPTHFRRGDKVYCRVLATVGQYQSETVASQSITIQNSAPTIQLTTVAPFEVPGRFQYQITASDVDGDTLTYLLLAPLDRGITIHPQSGLIEMDIAAPDVEGTAGEPVSSNMSITFQVTDSAGQSTDGSLSLNLAKGTEDPI